MNATTTFRNSLMGLVMAGVFASGVAMAQTATPATPPATATPGHAGVDKINNRLDNQQNRIQAGVKDGQLSAKQAASDETRDSNVAARESADEAKHNGHLTKKERHHINGSLNRDSHRIHHERKH